MPVLDEFGNQIINANGEAETRIEHKPTGEVTKSVKYSILYMKSVAALQEAIERIETLEAEVQALKQ